MASKNAEKTRGKPFEPGNPGGPGRRAGSRNKATLMLDKLAEGEAREIAEKMFEAAKGGDMRAAELVLSRIWPVRKGRPVSLALPEIETPADVVIALGIIANAVGAGEITPDEGSGLANVIEIKRRAIDTEDLAKRLQRVEQELEQRGKK